MPPVVIHDDDTFVTKGLLSAVMYEKSQVPEHVLSILSLLLTKTMYGVLSDSS
jgi:hypothetical protein